MKKLLEVCQYGDFDIRFNTDIPPEKLNTVFPELSGQIAFSMITQLWGGIEPSVLAIIRALAIADLAACANRKRMVHILDESSAHLVKIMNEAREEFERHGGKVQVFGLEDALLCKDDEDYDALVKVICVSAWRHNVIVVIYTVLSNHCHVAVLAERQESAQNYGNNVKKVFSMWHSRKYKERVQGHVQRYFCGYAKSM